MLTNEKITRPDGKLYSLQKDYYGYDPTTNEPFKPFNVQRSLDLIYIADTYGVYSDDLADATGERSRFIYGAMEQKEWQNIISSRGDSTMFIAEYNSFASPTEQSVREQMEQYVNVKWSGWTGRYFQDLTNDEVPYWLRSNYEQQYSEPWAFENGGLAFVHETDTVVVIDEKEIDGGVHFSLTDEGREKFPKAHDSDYAYWFDIVTPINNANVYAQYSLELSTVAQQELTTHSIPSVFPAIIYVDNTYYFAGDYADYTKHNLKRWQGGDMLMDIFSNDDSSFQWRAYVPVMRQILHDTAQLKASTKE